MQYGIRFLNVWLFYVRMVLWLLHLHYFVIIDIIDKVCFSCKSVVLLFFLYSWCLFLK